MKQLFLFASALFTTLAFGCGADESAPPVVAPAGAADEAAADAAASDDDAFDEEGAGEDHHHHASADEVSPDLGQHLHEAGPDDEGADLSSLAATSSCPTGYKLCYHGWCVPTSSSKVCHVDANGEHTTTTTSSLVCSDTWSSVSTKGHQHDLTWYSGFIATADKSGHTWTKSYKCTQTLACGGLTCNHTKTEYSGWLSHRLNRPTKPNYCLDCGAQFN